MVAVLDRTELEQLDYEELLLVKALYGRRLDQAQRSGDSYQRGRMGRAHRAVRAEIERRQPEHSQRAHAQARLWRAVRAFVNDEQETDATWDELAAAFKACPPPLKETR